MSRRLRHILVLGTCLSMALAGSASARSLGSLVATDTDCVNQLSIELSDVEQEVTMRCMHNYARRKAKLRSLGYNAKLQIAADKKAADMLACNSFTHTPCGQDAFRVQKSLGYATKCYGVAENIAWGSDELGNVRTIMSGWIHSAGHRDNLLNRRYRDVGVSMVDGTYLGWPNSQIWVATFGYRC